MNVISKRSIKSVVVILVITFLLVGLSGCDLFNLNLKFDEISFTEATDILFASLLDGDGLAINVFLDNPNKYEFESKKIAVPLPDSSESEYDQKKDSSNSAINDIVYELNKLRNLTDAEKIERSAITSSLDNMTSYYSLYFREYIGANGPAADVPSNLAIFRFKTLEDIEIYLEYLTDLTAAFDSYVSFEESKCIEGYGRSDDFYKRAIEAYRNIAPLNVETSDHNFVLDFNEKIDNVTFPITSTYKAIYKEQNLEKVDILLDAYRSMADEIESLLTTYPTSNRNQGGLAGFNKGSDYYNYEIFQKSTGTTLRINIGHLKLVNYIKDLQGKMNQSMPVDIDNLLNQIYASADNAFTIENAETVMAKLIDNMSDDFPIIENSPDVSFKLLKQSEQKAFVAGYYLRTPVDNLNATENIYINPNVTESSIYNLISHEGFPGHMFQNTYLKSKSVNKLRLLLTNTAWAEGWAEYCEEYAAEYFSTDALLGNAYKIYVLNNKLNMALRSYADIMVNFSNYTASKLKEAIKSEFELDFSEETCENLVNVAASFPGMYLPYTFGDIMIKEIKEAYFAKSSYLADIDFHTKLLEIGPMDFDELKSYM
ncbi:MAG: DUF885 domain-containing protein [Christensenellaceae bacterium]|jgi:uncharacterized protein (DUF885 family)|nr:DUF885 domain-containing protein [Christensenellaceae bacterium]